MEAVNDFGITGLIKRGKFFSDISIIDLILISLFVHSLSSLAMSLSSGDISSTL
jgi:hypothetical protein